MERVHAATKVGSIIRNADYLLRQRDLRVGQLIMNAIAPLDDPFYLEDEALAEKLEAYIRTLQAQ